MAPQFETQRKKLDIIIFWHWSSWLISAEACRIIKHTLTCTATNVGPVTQLNIYIILQHPGRCGHSVNEGQRQQ